MKITRYKHNSDFSYTLGMTLTIELLRCRPETVIQVYISPRAQESEAMQELRALCGQRGIPALESEKAFNILSPKGNCFVIGVFRKFSAPVRRDCHLVLVNPSDAGNIGNIMRSCIGFGITDLAVVRPAVDLFDPKAVRASMGALFHMHFTYYDSFAAYMKDFPDHNLYPFMLRRSRPIHEVEFKAPWSLIFGNEAAGLPDDFADIRPASGALCSSVLIPISGNIDSLNLTIAAAIAMYEVTGRPQTVRR